MMKRRAATQWTVLLLCGMTILVMGRLARAQPPDEEKSEAAEVSEETVLSLIRKGGIVMIPIGLCSVLALAIAVERFISLRHDKVVPPGFIAALREAMATSPEGTMQRAIDYCERGNGPVGKIFKAGILRLHKGEEAVEKAVQEAGAREVDKMKRSLRGLSVIATVSPLLGLLGTVYGMITAFKTATAVGTGKADMLAKGIYEALVTTAAGLTVAIPALLVCQYLNARVDSLVDEIDEVGIDFMASCVNRQTPNKG